MLLPALSAEDELALGSAMQRLTRLAQQSNRETETINQLFTQAAGRLSILGSMVSAEAAAGQIGSRALHTAEGITREVMSVSAIRRTCQTVQLHLAQELAALERPGSTIDLAFPYRSTRHGLSVALRDLQPRVETIGPLVSDPLHRCATTLDHLGVRIALGATDVDGSAATRVAHYSRRLKDLARLFFQLVGAIESYQQGLLATLIGMQRELGSMPAGASAIDAEEVP
ncbi:MAG TPA: hypothetical protein VHB98_14825 [Chloroflexota bacterium]|jgi:hypothetical protein|nr:hypothetical protein [Chloroflexota bacterium]